MGTVQLDQLAITLARRQVQRRLAGGVEDDHTITTLNLLATEYEKKADQLDRVPTIGGASES